MIWQGDIVTRSAAMVGVILGIWWIKRIPPNPYFRGRGIPLSENELSADQKATKQLIRRRQENGDSMPIAFAQAIPIVLACIFMPMCPLIKPEWAAYLDRPFDIVALNDLLDYLVADAFVLLFATLGLVGICNFWTVLPFIRKQHVDSDYEKVKSA
jgi:hypothetical protein